MFLALTPKLQTFFYAKNKFYYWHNKIKTNTERDLRNYDKIRNLGWNTIVIWTCQLTKTNLAKTVIEIYEQLI